MNGSIETLSLAVGKTTGVKCAKHTVFTRDLQGHRNNGPIANDNVSIEPFM